MFKRRDRLILNEEHCILTYTEIAYYFEYIKYNQLLIDTPRWFSTK